ncbi:MAG: hypothetical protein ABI481_10335 [Pyrinomonadaceae bacterium]
MEPSLELVCVRAISLAIFFCSLVSTCTAISLDSNFASGGKFTTAFSDTGDPSSGASRVFVQPSGRIVVIGRHQQQGATQRVKPYLQINVFSSRGFPQRGTGKIFF